MISLKQYYLTFRYFFRAAFIFYKLRQYLKHEFFKDLDFHSDLKSDYYYHSSYYNRSKQYMHANHFFGELLCLIRAFPLTNIERMRFANLSSCAPIFDDFFENETNLPHILSLLQHPDPAKAQTKTETLAVHFLNNILDSSIDKDSFIEAAIQLFQAQVKSKTQKSAALTKDEVLNISLEKGGFSGLMYALLLSKPASKEFLHMAYLLGGLGQLMDDIFDIYDDAQDGIRTFANQSERTTEIQSVLKIHQERILTQMWKLNQQGFPIRDFYQVLQIFQAAITLALLHYQKIEAKYQVKPYQCLQLERKIWIVDMEKPMHIWQLFHLSANQIQKSRVG